MSNDNKDELVDGLFAKKKRENAPDFVQFAISIRPKQLYDWLAKRLDQEWVNIDVNEKKDKSSWYCKENTWKKEATVDTAQAFAPQYDDQSIPLEDIPF